MGEMAVCYLAVVAANEALADGVWRGGTHKKGGGHGAAGDDDDEEDDGDDDEASAAAQMVLLGEEDEAARAALIRRVAAEAHEAVAALSPAALFGGPSSSSGAEDGRAVQQSLRGVWPYRVGLVGKPSAGKSSLFNALTRAGFTHTSHDRAGVMSGGASKR